MCKKNLIMTLFAALVSIPLFAKTLPVSGTLYPLQATPIQAGISGRVQEVLVSSGSVVEKGQVLARLDPLLLEIDKCKSESALKLAELNAKEARGTYLRLKRLWEKEGSPIPKRQLEEAEVALIRAELLVEQAALEVKEKEALLEEALIKAPYSGVIANRCIEVGQSVNAHAGDPLFKLIDLSTLIFEFTLPQTELAHIKPGLALKSQDGAPLGKIDCILPEISLESRSFTCKASIAISELSLKPGQFFTAHIELPSVEEQP